MGDDPVPAPDAAAVPSHGAEPHAGSVGGRLNWLRAGVLGANDGLLSTSGLVIGVAASGASGGAVLTAGIASVAAGASSMALGEWVSVSTQRDTERALIAKERVELREQPEAEFTELVQLWRRKGLSEDTARRVAAELTARDALTAHLDVELGIDQQELTNPLAAAISSAVSFTVGAALPVLAALIEWHRIAWILVAVGLGLVVTGVTSAALGGAPPHKAVMRLLVGGAVVMAITYLIGRLVGSAVVG